MVNLILRTDSYKLSHWRQYPPGTQTVYSYQESRGGKFNEIVFFGLQYYLRRYMHGVRISAENIADAAKFAAEHGEPFNGAGWWHILDKHTGHLPLSIRAVPEGTVVPPHNVLMTVENTCPECYWTTNWAETLLSRVWYPTTVATQSRAIRQSYKRFLEKTGGIAGLDYKVHDFGARGVTCSEQAEIGGMAHLTAFNGSDTMEGAEAAMKWYDAPTCPSTSIPAAEHSTITSWGRENELDAYRNMLQLYPKGLVSVVSDSYDIYHACDQLWGVQLHDEVMARDGTLVIRPDSGNPERVIPKVLDILGQRFGFTVNEQGYRVLDSHVRVLQGDGMNADTIENLLFAIEDEKWSAENLAVGSGGGLLQKLDRDTQKFAIKCSAVKVDGAWVPVFKQPITDPIKNSKKGRLALVPVNGISTVAWTDDRPADDLLVEVFRNGKILKEWTFDQVRDRARAVA